MQLGLEGVLQIAPFHPQFSLPARRPATSPTPPTAPYPTLHLIRRGEHRRPRRGDYPHAERIYGNGMALLERLGPAGWDALDVGARWLPPISAARLTGCGKLAPQNPKPPSAAPNRG